MQPIFIFAICCCGLIAVFSVYMVYQIVKLYKTDGKRLRRRKSTTTYSFYEKDENTITIEL